MGLRQDSCLSLHMSLRRLTAKTLADVSGGATGRDVAYDDSLASLSFFNVCSFIMLNPSFQMVALVLPDLVKPVLCICNAPPLPGNQDL